MPSMETAARRIGRCGEWGEHLRRPEKRKSAKIVRRLMRAEAASQRADR